MRVKAKWRGINFYHGAIVCVHDDGYADVRYDDGDCEARVRPDLIEVLGDQPHPAVKEVSIIVYFDVSFWRRMNMLLYSQTNCNDYDYR